MSLITKHDNHVLFRPLAGTRRRGKTPEDDAALEAELLADEKECAEHVMLVDLGRNDVGKARHPSPPPPWRSLPFKKELCSGLQ
jgi:anthranilate/para-aminobenzoate synthase component I